LHSDYCLMPYKGNNATSFTNKLVRDIVDAGKYEACLIQMDFINWKPPPIVHVHVDMIDLQPVGDRFMPLMAALYDPQDSNEYMTGAYVGLAPNKAMSAVTAWLTDAKGDGLVAPSEHARTMLVFHVRKA
jgi:hypothetical protein